MSNHTSMDPLSKVMKELQEKGFTENFSVEDNHLVNKDKNKRYSAKQVKLLYEYRTEGESNPDDLSMLFGLSCDDESKGIVVAAYGAAADTSAIEFINFVDKTDAEDPKML